MALYKRDREIELGTTEKQHRLVVRMGLKLATSGFQVRRPNHSATLPPKNSTSFILTALEKTECSPYRGRDNINFDISGTK